ncbi:hypothetical protein VULLAG_LOCUS20608 [Vulpes lagopus]
MKIQPLLYPERQYVFKSTQLSPRFHSYGHPQACSAKQTESQMITRRPRKVSPAGCGVDRRVRLLFCSHQPPAPLGSVDTSVKGNITAPETSPWFLP